MMVKIEANFKKGPKQDTYDTLHPPTHPLTHFFNIQPQLTYIILSLQVYVALH